MGDDLSLRILLVDASPVSAIIVAAVLETAGHTVVARADAVAALQDMSQTDFDVVVLGAPDPDDAGRLGGPDAGQKALATQLREAVRSREAAQPDKAARPDEDNRDDRLRIVALRQQRGRGPDGGAIDSFVARPLDPSSLLEAVAAKRAPDAPGDEELASADLDFDAFQDLVVLGGTDFAQEILDQFVADGARLLAAIARAAAARDFATFREEAHALRSCAANVGARGVYGLCLEWRDASASDLGRKGAQYVQALEREFVAASAQLRRRLALLMNDTGKGDTVKGGGSDSAPGREQAAG